MSVLSLLHSTEQMVTPDNNKLTQCVIFRFLALPVVKILFQKQIYFKTLPTYCLKEKEKNLHYYYY